MTLRTRFTLWHAAILLVSLVLMAGVFLFELTEDRRAVREGRLPLDSPLEEAGEFMLYFGLPATLLLVGGTAWLMRRLLRPVARLTEAAERIHLHNLQGRLPTLGTGDELDRLTTVFNAMTARLEESFLQVREFTLHASHELKTPLTIMRGELETALRDERCPDAQREFLAGLLDEVQRLVNIVDHLSLLAKADAGQLVLDAEPVRFDELVQEIFGDAQALAENRQLSVTLTRCDETIVRGDRHRLRQMLLNLVDNAIKYNHPRGTVEMALVKGEDGIELRITNAGPGIPPEQLPRVFDRFYRGDPAHGTGVEGCGLGLTIARSVAKAHGGDIEITSTVGGMTTVTVCLAQEAST